MDLITKLRYQGYIATPPLWINEGVSEFNQIQLNDSFNTTKDSIIIRNKRLGKLVEAFVFYQLKQQKAITWICDNLQIQNGKQTIGEIDALYYLDDQPIHLEVVYKFYLYDTLEHYNNPLAYWIGPNRKDSLLYKIDKLHNKQFPLLYNDFTKPYLKSHDLDVKTIKQQLCFKAQLFLPYQNKNIDINPLNINCISGFYISYSNFEELKNYEFYIPSKLDWLVKPSLNVNWTNYFLALNAIEIHIENKRSPMIWVKQNDANIVKCFITYW